MAGFGNEKIETDLKATEEASAASSDIANGEWTEEEEKRVTRKIDLHLVPLVTVLYLLCFIDRANIGNARIQGMQEDLDLQVGFRFNWALTIFYIPYLLVEVPANVALKWIGAKIWIPFLVFGFGVCSLCCGFVTSYQGLYAARFFLGVFEGGTMPGIAFFLSCFYKKHELMTRVGFFISGSSMAGAFGGLLATGLSKIPAWGAESMRIAQWRNIFFFEGIITILAATLGYYLMPKGPDTATFLTEHERFIAYERIQREHKEQSAEKATVDDVARGLLNISNTLMALGFFFCNATVQSFSLFLPTILRDLGWNSTKAQLLTVPPYAIACLWSIFVSWVSDRIKKRGLLIIIHGFIAMLGYIILITIDPLRSNIKYMAVFFSAIGAFPIGPFFLGWGLNNAAGPTIRAVASGYIVSIGTFGAVLATWTYLPKDAPLFYTGHKINIGCQSGLIGISMMALAYVYWENKVRREGKRDHRLEGLSEMEKIKLGYRHPEFRYVD
ncbi:MFS general substrate transporter [Ascodesmis nigricans]|uniref:MFS general substrate transporter n=1 Tax=Ascodesmis nigricans TaxID=341454 RepID=A0A4S2N2Q8_9PEZI|nr:MFS general substrate transporter [Ascodesmis nigricans]